MPYRMFLILSVFLAVLCTFAGQAYADTELDKIHFLIPAGAGGGWDGTARGVGEALTKSKLIKRASYQNMSGGSGREGDRISNQDGAPSAGDVAG